MNPLESIVTCELSLVNPDEERITFKAEFYTIHQLLYSQSNGVRNCDYRTVSQAILQYQWTLADKEGNHIKSYKKLKDITPEYIKEFFDEEYLYRMSYNYDYKSNLYMGFRQMFLQQINSRSSTYTKMGFKLNGIPYDSIKVTINTTKHRLAFSDMKTGECKTVDLYIVTKGIKDDNESSESKSIKALLLQHGIHPVEDIHENLKVFESLYNVKYIGCYIL